MAETTVWRGITGGNRARQGKKESKIRNPSFRHGAEKSMTYALLPLGPHPAPPAVPVGLAVTEAGAVVQADHVPVVTGEIVEAL